MTAEGACEVSKEKMEGEDSMEESADEQPRREREVCGEGDHTSPGGVLVCDSLA